MTQALREKSGYLLRAEIVAQLEPAEQQRLFGLAQVVATTAFNALMDPSREDGVFGSVVCDGAFRRRLVIPPVISAVVLEHFDGDADTTHGVYLADSMGMKGEKIFAGSLMQPEVPLDSLDIAMMEATADVLQLVCADTAIPIPPAPRELTRLRRPTQ